jgi:signal transduction histidine kinase
VTWEGQIVDAGLRTLDVEVNRTRLHSLPLPTTDVYVVHSNAQEDAANWSREQILTSVAHELRGPLSVLDNSLDILALEHRNLSVNDIDQMLRSARRSVAGLRDLMDDLLTAGRIQSGAFRVNRQSIAVATIVEDGLLAVEPLIAMRKQRLECNLAPEISRVLADRRSVRQVMAHLLRNASQYSPAGELIRIRAERADDHVRVTVEDRGPGIPAEQRAGLFERFYRVRPGYDEPGIGLGLAIAKGIIEAHGGSIGVETQVGQGTSVWFTLQEAKGPGPWTS